MRYCLRRRSADARSALAANQDVRAALDHVPWAAAVLVGVVQAVGLQVVDENGHTALDRYPGVGAATMGVNAVVGDPQGRTGVHHHVLRAGHGRAYAFVRATGPAVAVLRYQGIVAEPRLRLHCMLVNIAQSAPGRRTSWR